MLIIRIAVNKRVWVLGRGVELGSFKHRLSKIENGLTHLLQFLNEKRKYERV
jgi:hypothetical protein